MAFKNKKSPHRFTGRVLRMIAFGVPLTVLALFAFGQQIKKNSELVLKKDLLAFEVAEAKREVGRGNGTGTAILTGIAIGLSKEPMPDMTPPDHSNDPDYNQNYDSTVGLTLKAGMKCYAGGGDKVVVLGADGRRLLVELTRNHYHYGGAQQRTSLSPYTDQANLSFSEISDVPACLNKVKLWIDQDIFVQLQGLPLIRRKTGKKGDSADSQEAVRRAMGKQ